MKQLLGTIFWHARPGPQAASAWVPMAQPLRGEAPFLHVMRDNEVARQLYRRMGFADYSEKVVRMVSRCTPDTAA